jgi:hypothetical protein
MPLSLNGEEKRYINGREIKIKPKQPFEVQKNIDQNLVNISGDVKELRAEFDPDKIYREINELADSFDRDSLNTFNITGASDNERTRQRFYQIYREMMNQTFIKNSLNVIKNESAQRNDDNNLIKILSDNQDIVEEGYELFFDTLDLNFELKGIIVETCQMGDNFYEIVLDNYKNPTTIVHLEKIQQECITIIRENGKIKFYVYSEGLLDLFGMGGKNLQPNSFLNFNDKEEKKINIKILMPWQILHFKIKDLSSEPYGASLLKSGIKDYRRLALLEDAMLVYRLSRSVERRVFYVDVGQLNGINAKMFLNKIKNKFKKEPIIDESGNISERANVMCITLNTKIPLLDNRELTLQQLIQEFEEGKENWVYSVDLNNNNQIVPGKVINAACTRKNAQIVKVTLDNDEEITCTPDHKFILRNGEKKEAQYLTEGESLMPFYRKESTLGKRNDSNYELIYNPKTEKYDFTHRVVAKSLFLNEMKLISKNNHGDVVIHHKDFNKKNNSPNNLEWMSRKEHSKYHMGLGIKNLKKYLESEKHRQNVIKANKERNSVKAMQWYNGSELHKEHNEIRKQNMLKQFADPELRKKYIDGMTVCDKFTQKFWDVLDNIAINTKLNKFNYIAIKDVIENIKHSEEAMKEWNENISIKQNQKNTFNKKILERALKYRQIDCNQSWLESLELPTQRNRKIYKNHKVKNVRFLTNLEDTGCITVDKHHNFAISSGIVVNNSTLEDYYIPQREGSTPTRIETLPAGQQLNEIKDIDYFKDKLLRILNIPSPYIGGSPEQGQSEINKALASIDIKFSNFIEEIQQFIVKTLNKLLALQLILKKYKNEDIINFRIELTPPSNLAELIKLDFMTQQAAVAASYKGLQMFSDEWIYKKIFRLSIKEIYTEKMRLTAQIQQMQQMQMNAAGAMPGGDMSGGMPPIPGGDMGAIPGGDMGAIPGGDMGAIPGGEVAPPPEPPAQLASFDPEIYNLGLTVINENLDSKIINNMVNKFGQKYIVENEREVFSLLNEVKKLNEILSEKKTVKRNDFKAMVLRGEFNGIDFKNRKIKHFKDNIEDIIDLEGDENDDE